MNTKENHTERIVQPTTTDTGEHDERAFENVYTLMRSKQNITKCVYMMENFFRQLWRLKLSRRIGQSIHSVIG